MNRKNTYKGFFDRISTKDRKTIDTYHLRINVFENYCQEKFNTNDIFDELQNNWKDILQSYINWLAKNRTPTTVSIYFICAKISSLSWCDNNKG